MSKIENIVIDIDSTIIDSIEVITRMYNDMFRYHKDFKEADPSKVKKWSFSDQCPLLSMDDIEQMFDSPDFFEYAYLMKDCKRLVNKLHYDHGLNIIFNSKGQCTNVRRKIMFIQRHFPYAIQIPIISKWNAKAPKSLINMKNSIFVDDNQFNLDVSDAEYKILFDLYGNFDSDWNDQWDGLKSNNWGNVYNKIMLCIEDYEG